MHISWNSALSIFLFAFYVSGFPFTHSLSHQDLDQFGNHQRSLKINKVSFQRTSDIKVHGLVLWASMGFLMPLGILIIRISSKYEPGSRKNTLLFYLHVAFQMLSVLLATVGAAMSLKKFENSFDNNHQRLGLALYAAILVQALIGFFRPQRGKKERSYWYFIHWMLGTIVSLMGIINIYTGLNSYHKRTLKSTSLWNILFTAQVSFIAIFYLFQDKLDYMKRQAVVLHSDSIGSSHQEIPQQIQNSKELLQIGCEKRNALGNLFD